MEINTLEEKRKDGRRSAVRFPSMFPPLQNPDARDAGSRCAADRQTEDRGDSPCFLMKTQLRPLSSAARCGGGCLCLTISCAPRTSSPCFKDFAEAGTCWGTWRLTSCVWRGWFGKEERSIIFAENAGNQIDKRTKVR